MDRNKIIRSARTGEEMIKATLGQAPIHLYSDLCKDAKKHGILRLLAHMFKRSENHIILLQNPQDMSSGHWISISRNLPKKEIYFFSSYGGKPDVEKIAWLDAKDLKRSNQDLNLFNDGFHELQKHGWTIHYNDVPYQVPGDKTATCGIYVAAFIRSGVNPEEFRKQNLALERRGIDPVIYYYKKYFI